MLTKLTDFIKNYWKIGIFILILLSVPLTVFLVTQTQIFRSRASAIPVAFEGNGVTYTNGQYFTSTLTGIKLKLTSPFATSGTQSFNAGSTQDFYGKRLSFLKLFGQTKITEAVRNAATGHNIYHAPGVVVDKSSTPNKIYEVDSGNSRILGFNGIGYCSQNPAQSCTIDSDCGTGNSCNIDGNKNADIVFGQPDFESGACNKDANLGISKKPDASSLCFMGYPVATNTAEAWQRNNIEVDSEGNLYVADYWNNRILKYNQPFSQDKTAGKGDTVADFVWGQNDFSSNGINQINPYFSTSTRTPSNKSLWISFGFGTADHVSSRGVSVDAQNNLWVADTFNNRVLRFPKDSQTADLVLGQADFNSFGCIPNGPLNRFCTPTLARIDPENGDLYVSDEYPNSFRARILVFHPPFTNGMAASKSIVINQGPPWFEGRYLFQSTGFNFNPFKEGEYAAGRLWINELSAYRTTLIDANGNIVKVIGATTNTGQGGDTQYGSECGDIYNPAQFNLWWPGGSIGFDSANNIYLSDEFFGRVSRYKLPYQLRTVGTKTCLPLANGGLFPMSKSIKQDNRLGESIGLVVNNNQLIIKDESSIKVWNDYLQKSIGSNPDIILTGGMPTRILFSDAVDENNRLWMYTDRGDLRVYQLPFKGNDVPLTDNIKLYWKDDGTAVNAHFWETGLTVDKVNKAIYISDREKNRVLRISNYNEFLNHANNNLLVDLVLGQSDKTGALCNHGSNTPLADGICSPYGLKFDKTGNLFLIENNYECHGNDRISIFTASDLKNASGLFPMLKAQKVLIANDLTSKGPCAYTTVDKPGSPVSLAFDSHNRLVVGNDGYYGDNQKRQLKQLWYYSDPLNKTTPDKSIELPIGSAGELAFDKDDNLFIQDHTWYRVWGINYYQDDDWGIISTTTPTPTPTLISTPTATAIPTPTSAPEPKTCAQVITSAMNPLTGNCEEFPSPCEVPSGWTLNCTSPVVTATPTQSPNPNLISYGAFSYTTSADNVQHVSQSILADNGYAYGRTCIVENGQVNCDGTRFPWTKTVASAPDGSNIKIISYGAFSYDSNGQQKAVQSLIGEDGTSFSRSCNVGATDLNLSATACPWTKDPNKLGIPMPNQPAGKIIGYEAFSYKTSADGKEHVSMSLLANNGYSYGRTCNIESGQVNCSSATSSWSRSAIDPNVIAYGAFSYYADSQQKIVQSLINKNGSTSYRTCNTNPDGLNLSTSVCPWQYGTIAVPTVLGASISADNVKGLALAAGNSINFKLAKNPVDLSGAQTQSLTSDPMIIDFNFDKSNPDPGYSETIFVQFINSNGQIDNRQATITYQPATTTTSIPATVSNPTSTSSIQKSSVIKGDLNNNSSLDLGDMSVILSKWSSSLTGVVSNADLNGDGKVNSFDYSLMLNLLTNAKVIHN
ncbi:MAG: hypothetical protein PHQ59_00190 [Candidatus Daviesbacteria bacterium]|nr:hypothetical protein [Candidatus Daviesbacteria bacterium]